MRKLGRAALVSLLAIGMTALSGAAQQYEPGERANAKDVYCSGFVASRPLPANLRIAMAEDALGRIIYSQGDYIYLSQGRNGGVAVGQRYLVVRQVNNPSPVEAFWGQRPRLKSMGTLYQDIGWVEVTGVQETTATAFVEEACDALNAGDVLIPFEERPQPEYKPSATFDRFAPMSGKARGSVVLGKDFAYTVGQGDAIYVNQGTSHGVKVGDYFRLYRPGSGTHYVGFKDVGQGQVRRSRGVPFGYEIPELRDDLPRETLGEAFVVRVDQNSSTAVITLSLGEIHAGDFVELQPPAPPQANLTVVPPSIPRGASATLSWAAKAAAEVEVVPGIGGVNRRGSVNVRPTQTTTYTLTARGPGGSTQATATLTVVQPPPPPPPALPAPSLAELFAQYVQDIFFDFDKSDITPEAAATLQSAAEFLRTHPQARILIEGHCDEIGTEKYNMDLGVRRAEATKNSLVSLGVNAGQLETLSVGKQQPFCTESRAEPCRQLNRRAHFVLLP